MSGKPELLYFDIRGRAEPIRLLLEFVGVDYIDKQITPEQWQSVRATTPFHRMPVYREGDLVIPESFAIMHHLGRTHGLLGESEANRVRCDVTIEACRDYSNRIANLFGAQSNSAAARKAFLEEEQPALLADIEAFYLDRESGSPYWSGQSTTIADFVAFHLIDGLASQSPETLRQFSALNDFHEHFASQPRIQQYLSSSRRPAASFYGPNGKVYPKKER